MEILLLIALAIVVIYIPLKIIGWSRSNPTLKGVIISLILGLLPLYLILCFFGIMGEPRQR